MADTVTAAAQRSVMVFTDLEDYTDREKYATAHEIFPLHSGKDRLLMHPALGYEAPLAVKAG